MFFTLEALRAKKGDALLLHVGPADDRKLIVIDGGPSGVYRRSLKPRLDALRAARAPGGKLAIDLMMISHIDDDHIKGILDLTNKLIELDDDQEPQPYGVGELWHNSFDDVVGNGSDELVKAAEATVGSASLASASTTGIVPGEAMSLDGALVLASVKQGRQLRNNAARLGIEVNPPADGKVLVADGDRSRIAAPAGATGVEFLILGPSKERVEKLQADWDKKLPGILAKEQQAQAEAAAYVDRSVYNLASLVVLAAAGGKTMLLTGDARGDDVLAGASAAGLLDDGPLHLDVLKLPHHGSSNNVELDFFQSFTADHYVISGNGEHGNPNVETFELLFDSRRGDDRPFTIHLTYKPEDFKPHRGHPYPLAELQAVLARETAAGTPYELRTPADDAVSLHVDLLDPYDDR